MDSWASISSSLGLGQQQRSGELDPNAHVGNWSQAVGYVVVPCVLVGLVLHQLCCKGASRAVNSTDAPELEELTNATGVSARQVDSVNVREGKLVNASSKKGKKKSAPLQPAPHCDIEAARPARPKSKRKG